MGAQSCLTWHEHIFDDSAPNNIEPLSWQFATETSGKWWTKEIHTNVHPNVGCCQVCNWNILRLDGVNSLAFHRHLELQCHKTYSKIWPLYTSIQDPAACTHLRLYLVQHWTHPSTALTPSETKPFSNIYLTTSRSTVQSRACYTSSTVQDAKLLPNPAATGFLHLAPYILMLYSKRKTFQKWSGANLLQCTIQPTLVAES